MKTIMRKVMAAAAALVLLCGTLLGKGTRVWARDAGTSDFLRIFFIDNDRSYFTAEELTSIVDSLSENNYSHLMLGFGNNGFRFLLDDMRVETGGRTYADADVRWAVQEGNRRYNDEGVNELTQGEMTYLIDYAAAKGIGLIPLINTPAHMHTLVTAMEELGLSSVTAMGSAHSLNLENDEALAFTQAFVKKYIDYFAGMGCSHICLGGDEYANDVIIESGFQRLINNGLYDEFISHMNTLSDMVSFHGMTPIVFNDCVYYNGHTESGTFRSDIVVAYWTAGWGNFRPVRASFLRENGLRIISMNENWYYVLGRGLTDSRGYNLRRALDGAARIPCTTVIGSPDVSATGCIQCVWNDEHVPFTDAEKQNVADIIRTFAENNADYFKNTDGGNGGQTDPVPQDVDWSYHEGNYFGGSGGINLATKMAVTQSVPDHLISDTLAAVNDGVTTPPAHYSGVNTGIWSNYNAAQAGERTATLTFSCPPDSSDFSYSYNNGAFDATVLRVGLYFYVDSYSADLPESVRFRAQHQEGSAFVDAEAKMVYETQLTQTVYYREYLLHNPECAYRFEVEVTAKDGVKPRSGIPYCVGLTEVELVSEQRFHWDYSLGEVTVGSEDTAHGGIKENMTDGDPSTIWHSDWKGTSEGERYVTVSLYGTRAGVYAGGLQYTPRQGTGSGSDNGRIADYRISVSPDGVNWKVVATGRWENNGDVKYADFPSVYEIKYLKLEGLTTYGSKANVHISAAELRVLGGGW